MSTTIRPLVRADIAACRGIVAKNWDYETAFRFSNEVEHCWSNMDSPPIYYVAEYRGKIIGFAGMIPSWLMFGVWEFIWINILPEHQKFGVGKQLMEHRIREVLRQDGRLILAMTKEVDYFKQHGFNVDRSFGDWKLMSAHLGPVAI